MSMTLVLIPAAVAVGMSLGSSSVAALSAIKERGKHDLEPVETVFTDSEMLVKTLQEHGLKVEAVSENEYYIHMPCGTLHYFRNSDTEPFYLETQGIKNLQELLDALDSLENEYGRNVQAFTYDKVMHSLEEHGMSVDSEEVMDDESILLTLNIDG